MAIDVTRAPLRMLDARALPNDRSDDPRALPDVSPGVAKASFRQVLRRTGLLAAAPAEEEPPEEEFCTADAGVRPEGPTRLDGSPDDELPLPALPAPSRDKSAAEGVAVVLGGRPARCFLRGLPPEPVPRGIVLFHCARVLPSLLLPRLRWIRGCIN